MALQCGIVGLPNVGKSTIFNALTAAGIQAENYPFCTIEPNTGVVEVPDARLGALDEIVHSERVMPATVEFVDIAGIVKGASKGEGLGNKFLANIRETHAIVHVVRCFDDSNVVHVDGEPARRSRSGSTGRPASRSPATRPRRRKGTSSATCCNTSRTVNRPAPSRCRRACRRR